MKLLSLWIVNIPQFLPLRDLVAGGMCPQEQPGRMGPDPGGFPNIDDLPHRLLRGHHSCMGQDTTNTRQSFVDGKRIISLRFSCFIDYRNLPHFNRRLPK